MNLLHRRIKLLSDSPITNFLMFTAAANNSSVKLKRNSSFTGDLNIKYSTQDGVWNNYTIGDVISLDDGDSVKFIGTNETISTEDNQYSFEMTGSINGSGNVNALLNYRTKNVVLQPYVYSSLFKDCTSLITPPELPSEELAFACYEHMFEGCTGLTVAPELPAETLDEWCYYAMFKDCTSLTTAPDLTADFLEYGCYNEIFKGCSNINYIKNTCATVPADDYMENWSDGVAQTGTLIRTNNTTFTANSSYGIPSGWTEEIVPRYLKFTATNVNTEIRLDKKVSAAGYDTTDLISVIYYSLDNGLTWNEYTWTGDVGYSIILQNINDSVLFKGNNATFSKQLSSNPQIYAYYNFYTSKQVDCSGDIHSLVNEYGVVEQSTSWFFKLFADTLITSAPTIIYYDSFYSTRYHSIFYNCTSLKKVQRKIYTPSQSMFSGCTSLEKAPIIQYFSQGSDVANVFNGCSSLSYIEYEGKYKPNNTNWVVGVNTTGTFVYNRDCPTISEGDSGIPTGWTVIRKRHKHKPTKSFTPQGYLTFTSNQDASRLSVEQLSTHQTIYVSKDGNNWEILRSTRRFILDTSESYYVCGSLTADNAATIQSNGNLNGTDYSTFYIIGSVAVSGNCNYIWDYSDSTTSLKKYCGMWLFKWCDITSAPELPSTTLSDGCYAYMFYGCAKLVTTMQSLPATTLTKYCYYRMFMMCYILNSNITIAATITNNRSCASMFNECRELINPPTFSPQTLSTYSCSNMFTGCTSLISTPNLSGTSLSEHCYGSMFSGCTSLVNVSNLPATTLTPYCYSNMFKSCTSLTVAPVIGGTTLADYCYNSMFYGCTSLITAPSLPCTTLASNCYSFMFNNCTSLTVAPDLPATILTDKCYNSMFKGCSALITAPVLQAQTLVSNCYNGMFLDCTSLTLLVCLATNISASNCVKDMFKNVTTIGVLYKDSTMTGWVVGTNIPNTWTIQDYNSNS